MALPLVEDIRIDSKLFLDGSGSKDFQDIMMAAIKRGFQTPEGELNHSRMLDNLE